jgi:hypothetical protein
MNSNQEKQFTIIEVKDQLQQNLRSQIIEGLPFGVGSIQYKTPFDNGQPDETLD